MEIIKLLGILKESRVFYNLLAMYMPSHGNLYESISDQ